MNTRGSAPHAVPGGSTAPAQIETVEAELVPEPVTQAEAKRIDAGLRLLVGSFRDAYDKLQEKVHHAKTSGVHEVLGFASWTVYLADVLGEQPLVIEKADRPELHRYLFAEGMSTRAIAAATRSSQSTVVRDLAREPNDSPDEAASNLRDAMRDMPKPGPSKPVATTGLDNKSYSRPESQSEAEPKKPRKGPITKSFDSAEYRLRLAVQTVENLSTDGRLRDNKAALAFSLARLREIATRLDHALDVIEDVVVVETQIEEALSA